MALARSGASSVYVFTGRTLSHEEAKRQLNGTYLPPAGQGDVYRAALLKPRVIGLIDGHFSTGPAVWHKEILWAMAEGIHVFGSADVGALRASELAPFGMEGVGRIFEDYRDGLLEDDDEVAEPDDRGRADDAWRAEAMVNLRATFDSAEAGGILSSQARAVLVRVARDLYYPDRSYEQVIGRATAFGIPAAELAAFRAWLPAGRVDQKRNDALAMLRLIRERLDAGLQPKRVDYVLEHTKYWDYAMGRGPAAP